MSQNSKDPLHGITLQKILTELVDMVNDNKINTKKYVDYDMDNEKILSIHVLKKKKDKYVIKTKGITMIDKQICVIKIK